MKQIHKAGQDLESERVLAAIMDCAEESKKRSKNCYQANSLGPICILQIFRNNPTRGFRVRAETSGVSAGGGRTQQKQ